MELKKKTHKYQQQLFYYAGNLIGNIMKHKYNQLNLLIKNPLPLI